MKVKVKDYGFHDDMGYVTYNISDLDSRSLKFLNENLEGKTELGDDYLTMTIFYDKKLFPFQSDEAKAKMEDFIAREEIEMAFFISSFLEDLK